MEFIACLRTCRTMTCCKFYLCFLHFLKYFKKLSFFHKSLIFTTSTRSTKNSMRYLSVIFMAMFCLQLAAKPMDIPPFNTRDISVTWEAVQNDNPKKGQA